jgi:cytochrome c oxidase cbb3-type subunit 3
MSFRRPSQRAVLAILSAGALALAACRAEEQKPAAAPAPAPAARPAADPEAAAEAQRVYQAVCADCHGVRGAANGARSAELVPQPRNFQDPEWQRSVTNDHIERIIVEGGAAVGKSDAMPANPDLAGRPAVVKELRRYLRSLGE